MIVSRSAREHAYRRFDMAGPRKWRGAKNKRDSGPFISLPLAVLQSPGYRQAGHTARSLLIDIAMQYKGSNNGKLSASAKALRPLGWLSNATITRALQELISCGLLYETRKGMRPNRAAWFAITWCDLDQRVGLDVSPSLYQRSAYMRPEKPACAPQRKRTAAATAARQMQAVARSSGYTLTPANGAATARVAPIVGAEALGVSPSDGTTTGARTRRRAPSAGTFIEIPSAHATPGATSSTRSTDNVRRERKVARR